MREEQSNNGSEHSSEGEGMNSISESKKENASQFLHYTDQLVNEEFESDLSSRYEDKEMVNPIDISEFEYEDFNRGLSNVFTSDNKVVACSEGFRNESWFIQNGYPKQDNEENVIMDTICLVGEIESESSYSSEFSSYVGSFCEDRMGSDIKVFNNALYDEDFDNDQPIICHNVYKGTLHEVINPLFEEHIEV